jgi:hypothetical protein
MRCEALMFWVIVMKWKMQYFTIQLLWTVKSSVYWVLRCSWYHFKILESGDFRNPNFSFDEWWPVPSLVLLECIPTFRSFSLCSLILTFNALMTVQERIRVLLNYHYASVFCSITATHSFTNSCETAFSALSIDSRKVKFFTVAHHLHTRYAINHQRLALI